MDRQQTVEMMKTRLDQWNADLLALEKKASQINEEHRAEIRETIADLKTRKDQATRQLDQLKGVAEDKFAELSRGVQQTWSQVSETFRTARERFH